VYALDFTFAICVVITGCGAAQPESTRTVAMQSKRARRLDGAVSFADASGMAAKPQVISVGQLDVTGFNAESLP
jgi:hypothetical protein